jgi:hypothetical protein
MIANVVRAPAKSNRHHELQAPAAKCLEIFTLCIYQKPEQQTIPENQEP